MVGGETAHLFRAARRGAVSLTLLVALLAGCGDDAAAPNPSPTSTRTRTATAVGTNSPTANAPPTHTASPSASPSHPPTASPTASATLTPTASVTPSATASATVALTPVACADLQGRAIGGADIAESTVVAPSGTDPELCRVSGIVGEALRFELRLPADWNRKGVFLGGGGYDGGIAVAGVIGGSPRLLARGFATIATDSGHRGTPFDASWALDNEEAVQNFASLATHRVLAAARAVALTHYGLPFRRAYFEGGSSGGREALIAAQRFPEDFDGVIAREPALSFTALNLAANRIMQRLFVGADGFLPIAAMRVFSAAVIAACDTLDGLQDGIVANVSACHVDPAILACQGGSTTNCLTPGQIETIDLIHAGLELPFALANGVTSHPGFALSGAEDTSTGWPLWITGFTNPPPNSLLFTLEDQFFKYFVAKDPQLDSLTFSPAAFETELRAASALLDATEADLAPFAARNGKVILWHGWADAAISPYSTVRYYERVVAANEQAGEFVRFYTSPGVDHTGTGAGAPMFDLVGALDAWVEEGAAPQDLAAFRSGGTIPFRPLCRYPTYPRYLGSGDPNLASSFACTTP